MDQENTNQSPQKEDVRPSETPKTGQNPQPDPKSSQTSTEASQSGGKTTLPPEKDSQGAGTSDKQAKASRENGKKGGRPKGSISEATRKKYIMRQILVEKVHEEIEDLLSAKFDLAKGHYMYVTKHDPETGKEIVERIYKKAPDGKSLEYLLDQVIGKPTTPIEFSESNNVEDIELTEDEEQQIADALKGLNEFTKEQAYGHQSQESNAAPDQKQGA